MFFAREEVRGNIMCSFRSNIK